MAQIEYGILKELLTFGRLGRQVTRYSSLRRRSIGVINVAIDDSDEVTVRMIYKLQCGYC